MKQNKIKILHLFALFALALLVFYGCQKDDVKENLETSDEIQNVIGRNLSFQDIPNLNEVSTVLNKLTTKLNTNGFGLQKTFDKDSITIMTDDILYLTYSETHTYTFKMSRNNPEYYIENIVLHYNVDSGNYDEYLMQYDISAEEYLDIAEGSTLNENANVYITELDSGTLGSILNKSCTRTCQTYIVQCTAGGGHYPGDPECCATKGTCSSDKGGLIYQSCGVTCTNEPQDPIIDAGDSSGGGGGNGNVITNPKPKEPCISNGNIGISGNDGCNPIRDDIVPIQENPDCEKVIDNITKALSDSGDIRQILLTMVPFANQNAEVAITVDTNNGVTPQQGTQGSGSVDFETNPTNSYIAVAHTHDAYGLDGSGTYSVFSFDDMLNLSITLNNAKLDLGTFVAYLITEKGTRYAMTISNPTKFLDLFYMYNNPLPSTPNQVAKWTQSKENLKPLEFEYYSLENDDRKIKETDDDNETVLKEFLTFLQEGDAGITLFEANEDFSNFQPVKLDASGEVDRTQQPCNTQN
jgi:hypothetical protein